MPQCCNFTHILLVNLFLFINLMTAPRRNHTIRALLIGCNPDNKKEEKRDPERSCNITCRNKHDRKEQRRTDPGRRQKLLLLLGQFHGQKPTAQVENQHKTTNNIRIGIDEHNCCAQRIHHTSTHRRCIGHRPWRIACRSGRNRNRIGYLWIG